MTLLSGCVAGHELGRADVYSPSMVLANTKELEGKEILVRGWIGGCGPEENRLCGLYSSKRTAIGPEPLEWPLLLVADDSSISTSVRQIEALGVYVVTCRNGEMNICLEYDG